ncbi:MAG: cyclomaltodextrinase / maltogenic alpha-amylase / neopullulanase [Candidatus Sumerlaeota bacterium]|nr:cyclomaltodextrinase / maltogenic alpha-amylase / neopullulanase [Candidatus Sumerlaeota bacterium]
MPPCTLIAPSSFVSNVKKVLRDGVLLSSVLLLSAAQAGASPYANRVDTARAAEWAGRAADWRNGALVYQVIVDRFAPPADLEAKRPLYPPPKRLRAWDETPVRGTYVDEAEVWSHEIDFWGGDLQSLRGRMDYIEGLGVDVLYLNPIHLAYTNHKYDAQDYFAVSPEYGSRADVAALADDAHARGLRLVLDGVFNHMGRTSPQFIDAMADPQSPWRDWYSIGPQHTLGYRAWYNVPNLPELNLESPAVRARLWGDEDSVIQGYLREGVDGWRLDVGFDIGFVYLDELTRSAHAARPDSVVIGEIWNYPEQWVPAVDGVMNMVMRELILKTVWNDMTGEQLARNVALMVEDTGIVPLLRSWVIIDNHDTPRIATLVPEQDRRHLAQVLQFTLPGSPCIYYGVELGMTGGDDPEQRAPMRWDLVNEENGELAWMRRLIEVRNASPALDYGDFRLLASQRVAAFLRTTDRAADTVVVVANPEPDAVREVLMLRDSKMMSGTAFVDALSGQEFGLHAGLLTVEIPPRTAMILKPRVDQQTSEYTNYKRVQ